MSRLSEEYDALTQNELSPERGPLAQRLLSKSVVLWRAAFITSVILNLQTYLGLAITPWDESRYMAEARDMAQGSWPALADNPGFGILNSPLYHFFHLDPLWAFRLDAFDRLLCVAGFWIAAYLVSGEIGLFARLRYLQIMVLALALLATPALLQFMGERGVHNNISDGIFSVLSGLAFWQALRMVRLGALANLVSASSFLAVAELFRNDGIVLACMLLLIAVVVALRKRRFRIQWAALSVVIPFLLIVGGDLVIQHQRTGSIATGISERSYAAFQQGETLANWDGVGAAPTSFVRSYDLSVARYGTAAQNGGSILTVFLSHPKEMTLRSFHMLGTAVPIATGAYDGVGGLPGWLLLSVAALGLGMLWTLKRSAAVLACMWIAPLLVYSFTFFRQGYCLQPYFIVLCLAAIPVSFGLQALARSRASELAAVVLFLAVLAIFGLWRPYCLVASLGADTQGETLAAEQAATLLIERTTPGDATLSGAPPLPVLAAGRSYVALDGLNQPGVEVVGFAKRNGVGWFLLTPDVDRFPVAARKLAAAAFRWRVFPCPGLPGTRLVRVSWK